MSWVFFGAGVLLVLGILFVVAGVGLISEDEFVGIAPLLISFALIGGAVATYQSAVIAERDCYHTGGEVLNTVCVKVVDSFDEIKTE